MPVRGAVAVIGVPFLEVMGFEIVWGGAKAIPAANILSYKGLMYVLGQSLAFHSSNGLDV